MGQFLERLHYFRRPRESYSDGWGELRIEARQWEDGYRNRWAHDKVVRSTHGVNCTGSCGWKIHVKQGVITWETQETDYPRTRPGVPNHEPRGCSRGASYSWYLYSANRLKYPMVRGRLLERWRKARETMAPVEAWEALMNDPGGKDYKSVRGRGGFVRADWDEALEIAAASNIHTIKQYGPDRITGFTPIPAMSMVSYASGSRYISLIGGTMLSFYDWYCDLPIASPQTWGDQTDVAESADWYNSAYILAWGSNVPQTRTPDAHFFVEARYNGTRVVGVSPDYSELAKLSDIWLHPKQGTDSAVAMAMVHVVLREFFIDRQVDYFQDYCRRFTDLPMLVTLRQDGDRWVPDRYLRASDFDDALGTPEKAEWKTVALDKDGRRRPVVPQGSTGFHWAGKDSSDHGKWNLEEKAADGSDIELQLTTIERSDDVLDVAFPYFGGVVNEHFTANEQGDVLVRKVPACKVAGKDGDVMVATVFDLLCGHYGVDRELGGECASSYEDNVPYTPAWQEQITGTPAQKVIEVARGFADNAEKTHGRSMVIIGSGVNHWFHQEMTYRAVINMLMLCGTVGQSGGGWAHYTGQEAVRPELGWSTLAFGLDWARPPRQMAGTDYFYLHSDQWRYETVGLDDLLSPLANRERQTGSVVDCSVRAQRMGWLPSAPQLNKNPLAVARDAAAAGVDPKQYVVDGLESGRLSLACEDPDNPDNFPRNLFVWRSNLLGSSGKGHEYFLKHFLGTRDGVQGKDLGEEGRNKPEEVTWRDEAPEGKLDLVVTLDFRMSTTALYSDIVLPTASWYEKQDISTTDLHPFINPFTAAVDPVFESRSDWEIFKAISKKFSDLSEGHLGKEADVVLRPIMHDTPGELAQPFEVADWKKGECKLEPGVTGPNIAVVERDYPATHARFTSVGPLLETEGASAHGINWNMKSEVEQLAALSGTVDDGPTKGRPRIDSDIDACETILMLDPVSNGEVSVRGWEAVSDKTRRSLRHLAADREREKFRFRDLQAQPKKAITAPTWSGVMNEEVGYAGHYINVHELVPWHTLTGRQHFYLDHGWIRDFGEAFPLYRPPIDTRSVRPMLGMKENGNKEIMLNFVTPHQKWGIHSTYTDNLIMLTLSRGGPIVWISEVDAGKAGIEDNDWIECFNVNGSLTARAVVSQRINEGMCLMYHAQEKIVNAPGSEITGQRGGIHNSVTRIMVKPTQMIGGAAQFSWSFNYYGPVGNNRDGFVIVRKMDKIDWMDRKQREAREAELDVQLPGVE